MHVPRVVVNVLVTNKYGTLLGYIRGHHWNNHIEKNENCDVPLSYTFTYLHIYIFYELFGIVT